MKSLVVVPSTGSAIVPRSDVMGFSVELGRWHNTECLKSRIVILECKEGRSFDKLRNNEALGEEDIMSEID